MDHQPTTAIETATPMMAQYLAIKEDHPNALLLYRMGDFFEMFFEDAEKASATLGIALTKRGKHKGADIAMCGVPVHALDQYLQKLIRHGHRCAICEQIEDPADAKKRGSKSVVARAVVRLITPGTITEDALLDAKSRNYLAALTGSKATGEMALAFADISTGEVAVMATDKLRLASDLARLDPSEILVNDALVDDLSAVLTDANIETTSIAASRFESVGAEHVLKRHYGVETLEVFGDFRRVDISALGALIDYITLTQVGNVPYLRAPRKEATAAGLMIDAATRTNLELVKSQQGERSGSLLACITETITAAGTRALGDALARPLADPELINQRLDVVSYFFDDERLNEELRQNLKAMPDIERALARLTSGRGGPRDLAAIRDGLKAKSSLLAVFASANGLNPVPEKLTTLLMALAAAPQQIFETLKQGLADELPHLARDGGFIKPGFDGGLDENKALRDETRQVIAALQAHYAQASGVRSLKIKHNNVLGYFIEVTTQQAELLKSSEASQAFIHRQTIASASRFTTTKLAELEQKISTAAARVLAIELAHFELFVAQVSNARATLSAAAQALAEIDVHSSLAYLAKQRRYVRPIVDHSLTFQIIEGRHPVVEEALRKANDRAFAGNDCDLSTVHKRLWLLTGPNMAGKSTFLRQNALIAILAQAGSFVPARSAHIGCVDRLYSRVGAADDLARGRSTFMVEMIETAAILNQATPRSLVILDEIGRGTATYDGLSIAWATLEHLHDINASRALFATHYHELTALTATLKQLYCATMKVKEWKGDIIFLHEVGPGAAERSYGIQAAKLAGLPSAVIARATEVLKRLEEGRSHPKKQDLVSELPLFSAVAKINPPRIDDVRQKLVTLNADDLSPREALSLIYELRSLALKPTE